MIKRTIFYIIFVAIVTGVMVSAFRYFEPKDESDFISYADSYNIEYLELTDFNAYLQKNQDTAINVIFYQESDINSQYLFNDVLPVIYEEYGISSLDGVIYVQLQESDYKDKLSFTSTYGFSKVPALVNLTYSNGTITINNVLVDTETLLINHDSVVDWLITNEIIEEIESED